MCLLAAGWLCHIRKVIARVCVWRNVLGCVPGTALEGYVRSFLLCQSPCGNGDLRHGCFRLFRRHYLPRKDALIRDSNDAADHAVVAKDEVWENKRRGCGCLCPLRGSETKIPCRDRTVGHVYVYAVYVAVIKARTRPASVTALTSRMCERKC